MPFLVPIIVIAVWLVLSAIFSATTGWSALAGSFRAARRPEGEKFFGQVKQIGLVPQNQVTHMVVSREGLYLYNTLLFRFLHPALLIPWTEVHYVGTVNLFAETFQFELASVTRIRVTQRAYEAIVKYLK